MRITLVAPEGVAAPEPGPAQDPTQNPSPDLRPGGALVRSDGTPRKAPAEMTNPLARRGPDGRLLPGQSLNPGGRKAGLKQILGEVVDFRKVIEMVASIAYGPLAPAARMPDRIKAAQLLLAYQYGMPHQTVDVNEGKVDGRNVKALSTDKLNELRATIRKSLTNITDAEIVED